MNALCANASLVHHSDVLNLCHAWQTTGCYRIGIKGHDGGASAWVSERSNQSCPVRAPSQLCTSELKECSDAARARASTLCLPGDRFDHLRCACHGPETVALWKRSTVQSDQPAGYGVTQTLFKAHLVFVIQKVGRRKAGDDLQIQ